MRALFDHNAVRDSCMRVDPHEDTERHMEIRDRDGTRHCCMRVDPHEDTERRTFHRRVSRARYGCMRVDPHEDTERQAPASLTWTSATLHEGRSARGY